MPKRSFPWIALLAICVSCKQSPKEDALLTSLRQSLDQSSRSIESFSAYALQELSKKQMEPGSNYKAGIWLPKAEKAGQYKKQLTEEIERIESDCNNNDGSCNEADLRLLKAKVKAYADSTIAIDPLIKQEFEKNFTDSIQNGKHLFSIVDRLISTDKKPERDILLAELKLAAIHNTNKVICFCSEQVPSSSYYEVSVALFGQNAQILQAGEQLEITAGVGSFSRMAQAKALINGKIYEPGEDGTIKYRINPTGKNGTYSIPVQLDFLNEDGKPVQITKTITYQLRSASAQK